MLFNSHFNTPNITAEEITTLSKEEEDDVLFQLGEHQKSIANLVEVIVEKRVLDTVIRLKSEAQNIKIDPDYRYNDEGFRPDNIMVWVDGNSDCFDDDNRDLQEAIDEVLEDVAPHIRDTIDLDVSSLKVKYKVAMKKTKARKVGHINK